MLTHSTSSSLNVHHHMSVACFFSSIIYDTHAKTGQNQLKLKKWGISARNSVSHFQKNGVHQFYTSSKTLVRPMREGFYF